MLVKELIDELKKYDEDVPIAIFGSKDGTEGKSWFKDDIKVNHIFTPINDCDIHSIVSHVLLSPQHIDLKVGPYCDESVDYHYKGDPIHSFRNLSKQISKYICNWRKKEKPDE